MDIQQRIFVLSRHATQEVIAATLGLETVDVAAVLSNPVAPVVEGGPDLGAVDQDIVVQNGHQVRLQDGPSVGLRFDVEDFYAAVFEGDPDTGATSVYVVNPGGDSATGHWVAFNADGGLPEIRFGWNGQHANIVFEGDDTLSVSADLKFTPGDGPVIRAPDGSVWRVVVANSGALSTEFVQAG